MFKDAREKEEYLQKNKVIYDFNKLVKDYFEWDEEGNILLDSSKCCQSIRDITNYATCIGWIMLPDGSLALLKNSLGDVDRRLNLSDYNIARYNCLLMPELARQFGLESAQYYFAKRVKNRPKTSLKFILTTDFRNKEKKEELVEGLDILSDDNIFSITEIIEQMEDYLIENGARIEDIEQCKRDFLKQTLFHKFIEHTDENNGNWGIIKDQYNHFQLAPCYDLDCACRIHKTTKKRRQCDNTKTDLQSFIEQYKEESWLPRYLEEVMEHFSLQEAYKKVEENTKIKIPEQERIRYEAFFQEKQKELKKAYELVIVGEEKGEQR